MLRFPGLRLRQLGIVATIVLKSSLVFAQSDNAVVSGRVTDQTGDVIPGAGIRVTNVDTALALATQSNQNGIYVIGNLRPGRYRLVVEKAGFATIVLEELTLAVQDVLGRNFTMQLSPVIGSVTVEAGRDVQHLSPAVSTVVDPTFVDSMPLNGRSFQSLIQLTPGVLVMAAGQGIEGQFIANGQRTNSNYFTVDGVGVNFATNISVNLGQNLGGSLPALSIAGGTNSLVSVDAMQEFRTQTSSYAPEFGRMPGAQIAIVTKSGTNRFHGSLYDYVRDEMFDARNWFNRPPEPQAALTQHNFGVTLGGPVLRNRTFFFFSYEGLRLGQSRTATASFYTPETRAAAAPIYQPIVNALPLPNGPLLDPTCDNVTRPCLASLTIAYSDPTSFDGTSLRVDQTLRRNLTLFMRASHAPSTERTRAFASIDTAERNTEMVTGGVTAVLTASLLNDLRINWGQSSASAGSRRQEAYGAVPPPVSSLFAPGLGPDSGQAFLSLPDGGGSVGEGDRASNAARQINIVDTFSILARGHQLKLGVDYRYFRAGIDERAGYLGIISTFDQLKAGTVGRVAGLGTDGVTARVNNWSAFIQDTWAPASRLTLTYGVRWEANSPPESITSGRPLYPVEGIFDSKPLQLAPPGTPLWHSRYDGFAPRVGAAYQVSPSTILRGGSGLVQDLGYGRMLGSLISGFPYDRFRTTVGPARPFDPGDPAFSAPPFSTSLNTFTTGNLVAFDPNLRLPFTLQWNAAVERMVGAAQAVSVTYVGANGRRLLRPDFVVPPSLRQAGSPPVSVTRNAGRSRYNALQTQFERRLHRGLRALASYTLAESRDTESDDGGGNFFGAALNTTYAVSLDQLQLPPLAPSDFDIRHSFSAALSYEVPTPEWGGFAKAVFRDWGLDTIVRASSAPPVNVRIEGVSPELGVYRTQPDMVPGEPIWLSAPQEPGGKVLNPAAFTLPPAGQMGNLPRNSIRSLFNINQTDFSVRRRFPFNSGVSLEFRADAFNVFNHPMFGGQGAPVVLWGRCTTRPCTGQQSQSFGKVAGVTLNEGLGGDPLSGGQSAIYAIGGSRSIQFSLKLRF